MVNVFEYGAVGDGVHSDTQAIQRALDAGGLVRFPPGRYLTGTIYLRSHGGLLLEPGAEIVSGGDDEQWNEPDFWPENRWGSVEGSNGRHLIVARDCEDLTIIGGRINGSYQHWISDVGQAGHWAIHPHNGQMIYLVRCRKIRIQDCELVNSPYWNCFLHGCQDAHLSRLRIYGDPKFYCNDGIDLDCCQRATVSDCIIDTADDALAIRGNDSPLGENIPCEQIAVTNCVLYSSFANGVRIGVGDGTIRNAVFSNLTIHGTGPGVELCAKYGKGPGGTDMENIRFENLVMDVGRAFEVRLNQTLKETVASPKTIRNISFCHVTGKVYLSSRIRGNGVGRVDNVLLSDVDLDYYGVGLAPFVDATGMWARDSSDAAFEVEHASNVRLQDIRCRFLGSGRDGWKHAVRCQDASGFLCRDCDFEHLDTIS